MLNTPPIEISHFSDVLCVWAYVGQIRVDELRQNYGQQLRFDYRFIPLFADTQQRIGEGWKDRGGFTAFNRHVLEVGEGFGHVSLHPELWLSHQPRSSCQAHLVIKAAQLLGRESAAEILSWAIRSAFFRDNKDISQMAVLMEIVEGLSLPVDEIERLIHDGSAMAALFEDIRQRDAHKVEGSPTFVLNQGRQKLYGNVGYRVIDANIQELLSRPHDCASWC